MARHTSFSVASAALVLVAGSAAWQPNAHVRPALTAKHDGRRSAVSVRQAGNASLVTSEALQADITSDAVYGHLETLQAIAYNTTGRNREFGTEGHNNTALYFYDQLAQLGDYYDVEYQYFTAAYSGGNATLSVNGVEQNASLFTYTPNGQVEAQVVAVSNLGCNASDFPAEVAGAIALISRGTCEFGLKSALAGAAGAAGAIIYNNADGELSGTLGSTSRPEGEYPPTVGVSQAVGQNITSLLAAGEVTANLVANAINEDRVTINVIAQTKAGDPDNVLVIGAHSDSVEAGPGINDNGSGCAAILEVALQLAAYGVNNAVRFAFWSAEEAGLLGAEHYVNVTSSDELDRIRLYLNFDMIGSPNYVYAIYDGDGSAFNQSGPAGSAEAEALFEDYFAAAGLASVPTEFDGRSDYGPFLDVGIASGGLFTGAEGVKTDEEAALFGGTAGESYDVNYHAAGDTLDNINKEALLVNSQAIAHAVATYAASFDSLPAKAKRTVRRRTLASRNSPRGHKHKRDQRV